jgi:glutamyl-tRNA reductase
MICSFKAVSLSYKNAPIKVRESVALNEEECRKLLAVLKSQITASDILVLSTCNRTEVYYHAQQDYSSQIIQCLTSLKGLEDSHNIALFFDIINSPAEAIRHLFNVSVGLESQVIGDLQISNQVKRAYQYASDGGLAGPFLHRLMHTVFSTSKHIVQETCFRDGAASVSYATVELIKELTSGILKPVILIIGLGEIGGDVCKNLCKAETGSILVANRTLEKSLAIAAEYEVEVVKWEQVPQQIAAADVIVSAVPGLQPFLKKAFLENLHIADYKCFIDLSMPRSIESSIEEIPGVLLYNIDTIKSKASQALERRKAAIPQVKELIAGAITEFNEWLKEMTISPVIHDFKKALEQIRQGEMNRHMKSMSEEESQKIELITKNILQKILKSPVLELKAASKRGEPEQLTEALRALFNLQ